MSGDAVVTSAENARFRALRELVGSARDRREAGRTILDGVHLVRACREAGHPLAGLVVSESGLGSAEIAAELAAHPDLQPMVLADRLFRQLSTVTSATGILAVIDIPRADATPDQAGACVLLENVQDPGNLGSILRTAAAAGLRSAWLSPGCADAWSPRVLRAGMGAHFHLGIHERVDLQGFAAAFPGTVLALDQRGTDDLYDLDLRGTTAFLFGNEGAGLSPSLQATAARTVRIPMPGAAESLGVAAAAAICLFERVRQLSEARTGS